MDAQYKAYKAYYNALAHLATAWQGKHVYCDAKGRITYGIPSVNSALWYGVSLGLILELVKGDR